MRPGFTIVELLVGIGIVGLLCALLIPAVQHSRATARRIECASHLKQIGVAVHACATNSGTFPSYSWIGWIDLGRAAGIPQDELHGRPALNSPLYRCPQDSMATRSLQPSYVMNSGVHFRTPSDHRDGFSSMALPRSPQEFVDGQSQTAAFSERLLFEINPRKNDIEGDPRRYLWWTSRVVRRIPGNEEEMAQVCRSERTTQWPFAKYDAWFPENGYDHRLPPNHPACWNGGPDDFDNPDAYEFDPTFPPSSEHSGGVNLLFVDGHVAFIANEVDLAVWHAIGTINGSEPVELPNFN